MKSSERVHQENFTGRSLLFRLIRSRQSVAGDFADEAGERGRMMRERAKGASNGALSRRLELGDDAANFAGQEWFLDDRMTALRDELPQTRSERI